MLNKFNETYKAIITEGFLNKVFRGFRSNKAKIKYAFRAFKNLCNSNNFKQISVTKYVNDKTDAGPIKLLLAQNQFNKMISDEPLITEFNVKIIAKGVGKVIVVSYSDDEDDVMNKLNKALEDLTIDGFKFTSSKNEEAKEKAAKKEQDTANKAEEEKKDKDFGEDDDSKNLEVSSDYYNEKTQNKTISVN